MPRAPYARTPNLERLKAEIDFVKSKRDAKKYRWGYLDYFFGGKPEVERPDKKKQGKSVQ